jgi:hypothetical protein
VSRDLFSEPNACVECHEPLEQFVIPETEPDVIVQLGRLCRACEELAA